MTVWNVLVNGKQKRQQFAYLPKVNYYRLKAVALWLGCKPTKVRHLYGNLRPQALYPEALYTA